MSEESDEGVGWLEFIDAAGLLKFAELQRLVTESRELAAIMSASYGTARDKERNKRNRRNGVANPQSPTNYAITRLPNYPMRPSAYPASTGREGSDDHSDHEPA